MVPDLLHLAEQRQQPGNRSGKSVSFAVGPPAAAAAARSGSSSSRSGAAGEEPGLEEQPSLDVHQQALARASCELPPEAVEAARRELEAVSSGICCDAPIAGTAAAVDARASAAAEVAGEVGGAADEAAGQQAEQQPADGPAPAAAAQPAAQPGKPQRPPKGALLDAFATLVKDLYLQPENGEASACAAPLLRTLRAFPIAGARCTLVLCVGVCRLAASGLLCSTA